MVIQNDLFQTLILRFDMRQLMLCLFSKVLVYFSDIVLTRHISPIIRKEIEKNDEGEDDDSKQ